MKLRSVAYKMTYSCHWGYFTHPYLYFKFVYELHPEMNYICNNQIKQNIVKILKQTKDF